MAIYDDFAWFDNRYWNEEFHGLAFSILTRARSAGRYPSIRRLKRKSCSAWRGNTCPGV